MLSDLPDCIILHILSLLNTKDAVQTCILSVRWKDLWKRLPALVFHISDFRTIRKFTKFVSKVLSLHDSSLALQYVDFDNTGPLRPHLIKRVVNYAISHNVQQLGLCVNCNIPQIPLTLFSSQSLTHLNLSIFNQVLFPKSFNLPSLTNLHLERFAFCADDNVRAEPFSAFNRLNSLILDSFAVRNTLSLCISSATLVNFTTKNYSEDYFEIELLTPSLVTFVFTGRPYQKVFGSDLSYLKHVDIDAVVFSLEDINPSLLLLSWLLEFENIKSLTVTTSTLQFLSLNSNLLKTKLPSFGNLKLLKVKKKSLVYSFEWQLMEAKLEKMKSRKEAAKLRKSFKAGLEPSAPIPDGIVDLLIQNSPSAEVEIIDYPL
ncbi:F-box/FBD/LRR-repeat protein At1g78750-like [Vicia villosa]|uniref:F-box/FBD/LRR-repeat protein At1g78750-like n=1 Tax=Vicia villosa TaxID=3911 RepID=UPI00273AEBB6|nr:F-box/FBD/LRR-repeat protein At1g78750-like [Vicia villosa]